MSTEPASQRSSTPNRSADSTRAVYIHVPFCARRCGYCDFSIAVEKDHLIGRYLSALEREIAAALAEPLNVETVFIGGGTPTQLSTEQLAQLLQILKRWFHYDDNCEITIEANPAGLTAEKIATLCAAGVNRISLGLQSFDDNVLELLGRDHRRAEILNVLQAVKAAVPNFSLDLIFGVPGQCVASWRQTLDEAIAYHPPHISTYGLTYEKGTVFWSRRNKGEFTPVAEECEREMYDCTMGMLGDAGYLQYEISNFALPGYHCKHNRVYWTGLPYAGFGPGAASFDGRTRRLNHRSFTTWLKRVETRMSPVVETETLSTEDHARELLVLGLRCEEGVHRAQFQRQTGFTIEELAEVAVVQYGALGLLEDDGRSIRLTREGKFVADAIIVDFL